MMNCQQATRLLSDAQERKLSITDRAALKVHVMMCAGCRNFGEQMHSIRHTMREYAKGEDTQGENTDSGQPGKEAPPHPEE